MKRIAAALTFVSLLVGLRHARHRRRPRPTTPTVGERIPVLQTETSIEVDPALADMPVSIPGPIVNPDWAQSGGNASKSMGHVALGDTLDAGVERQHRRGQQRAQARLASEPVVADGRVYTIDTRARGARVRRRRPARRSGSGRCAARTAPSETLFGGGVAFDNGRIYATNGAGDAAALDAATGNDHLDGEAGRAAARRADHRQRQCLCDQPGQPALRAQRRRTARRAGAARARSSWPACSASPRRPSPSARWSPASPRASSPPIATRTARSSGRTRWRAPASPPSSARSPTSTPIR